MENTKLFGAPDFPFWHMGYWVAIWDNSESNSGLLRRPVEVQSLLSSFHSAQATTLLEFHVPLTNCFVHRWFCAVHGPKPPLHRHNWLSFGKFQDTERFLIHCACHFSSRIPPSGGTCKYAKAPSTKKLRDSVPIDMLLSALSFLVVAQSSSEVPEGLMKNPVVVGQNERVIAGESFSGFCGNLNKNMRGIWWKKNLILLLLYEFQLVPFGNVYCYVCNLLANSTTTLHNLSSETNQSQNIWKRMHNVSGKNLLL